MKKALLALSFALINSMLFAQDSLSLSGFLQVVHTNHPLFEAARLNVDMASGKLMAARGKFDPTIEVYTSEKTFNGSDYFDHNIAQLKIPVYSGIELKTGYELNTGKYLNPELTTPAEGLYYTEIAVPVLRNLLINQGRAEVLMQEAMLEQSEYELRLAQNNLIYHISSVYWEYQAAYELLKLYRDAIGVAQNRFDFVKRSYSLGKYAAIDTVEAYMEWQRRLALLNETEVNYALNSYALSNQYWLSDSLSDVSFNPLNNPLLHLDSMVALTEVLMVGEHPAIRQIDQKIATAAIKSNLQKQQLLPDLTLRYKPLTAGGESLRYSSENFTWGATFSMPLFLRKERGKLVEANSKLDQLQYERLYKVQGLSNDIRAQKESLLKWQDAVAAQRQNVLAAQRMLEAERRKLQLGSATIFMVNYRERYYLDAQEKLIKTQKEFNKAQSAYLNKLGVDVFQLIN